MNNVVKMGKERNNNWQYDEQNRKERREDRRKRDSRRKGRENKRNFSE